MDNEKFKRNIILSILAQVSSLLVNLILNLLVPKYLGEIQYAYWQVYILYVSYVGLLHFGMLDGMMLRYAQYDYAYLNKKIIRNQLYILLFFTSLISILMIFFNLLLINNIYKNIIITVSLGVVIKNIYTFISYTFQMTNRIKEYSFFVIIDRIIYGFIVILLLISKNQNYILYCYADLISDILAIILSSFYNKELYFGSINNIKSSLKETELNIKSGILLLIANWSSMFLVGSAKMIIQWKWNELVFGKVSFSFSVTNLFLTFITAISVVLFPSLKRTSTNKLPYLYNQIRKILIPLLLGILSFYYPGCFILKKWLPRYNDSLKYLGILLPVIVYTSKVSLLTNNYFKTFRKEKIMFIINLAFVLINIFGLLLIVIVFENLLLVLIYLVFIMMIRSFVSEYYISKYIKINIMNKYWIEVILTSIFILSSLISNLLLGFFLYFISFILTLVIEKYINKI